jgi:hypothetical protein
MSLLRDRLNNETGNIKRKIFQFPNVIMLKSKRVNDALEVYLELAYLLGAKDELKRLQSAENITIEKMINLPLKGLR